MIISISQIRSNHCKIACGHSGQQPQVPWQPPLAYTPCSSPQGGRECQERVSDRRFTETSPKLKPSKPSSLACLSSEQSITDIDNSGGWEPPDSGVEDRHPDQQSGKRLATQEKEAHHDTKKVQEKDGHRSGVLRVRDAWFSYHTSLHRATSNDWAACNERADDRKQVKDRTIPEQH